MTSRRKNYDLAKAQAARPLKLWLDNSNSDDVRIEIIPLMDVIFCILTFFILAAVGFTRQQAIDLDLPKASTGTAQMRQMLVVSLDDLGNVYVEEEQVVTRSKLLRETGQYIRSNPAGTIALNASREVSYNQVVELLDLLRLVGGDRVALATLPGASDKSVFLNLDPDVDTPSDSTSPPEVNPTVPLVPTPPVPTPEQDN